MGNLDLIRSLERAVYLSKGTRIQRLSKSPAKLLYSKILELIALWFRKPFLLKAKTFWDEQMVVVIPESVSLTIYRYGFFEEDLTRILLEYLKPGMTFFDIGAHFGYFTLLASVLVDNEGQVHSFEPILRTFNTLKSNVVNKKNVFLNNCAVFSKRKIVVMTDYGVKYSAYNSLYAARLPKDILSKLNPEKYEIEAISIDEYVKNSSIKPDFVKIDAESSEYEILLGMEETIYKFHPIVSLEVGDFEVNKPHESKHLINFLTKKGYEPHEFMDSKILPHPLKDGKYQAGNILFLPH